MTVPDTHALRRRVLLTGLLALVLFFATGALLAWLDPSGKNEAWFLIALAVEYLVVIRPLMAPVREAVRLRRRLAYEAWLDEQGRRK